MTLSLVSSRRGAIVAFMAVLLVWPVGASAAFASTGTAPGSDRAAAVQTVLDRVLGPGNSTVVVSDTIQTSTTATTSVRWGSGVAASVAMNKVVSVAGTSVATSQQNLLGSTTTVLATPAGSLVDQSVSVVVDRAHLGSIHLATLRRLVTASAGIVASRGDRISIVVTRFAKPAPLRSTASGPLAWLTPYVVPAIWALGAILAVLILGVAFRGWRRPAAVGSGIQRA